MDLFKKSKASDIGALAPKAARWALGLSLPAMREPAGFKYPRFKLGDWRSRRSATAAIACQLVQQGLDELSLHVGLASVPHPLFDLDAYDTSMADRAEAAQSYGRLKLGAASVGFWPSRRRVDYTNDSVDSVDAAPKVASQSYAAHWRLRASTAMFGSVALSIQAQSLARKLLEAWLVDELEQSRVKQGSGSVIWASFERAHMLGAVHERASQTHGHSGPMRPRL
jgi:hypothetical protein